jgi:hypothetical protein
MARSEGSSAVASVTGPPELEPLLEPELLPELEPLLDPELLPELEPLLDPELPPELEPLLDPELPPELEPPLDPELPPEPEAPSLPPSPEVATYALPQSTPSRSPQATKDTQSASAGTVRRLIFRGSPPSKVPVWAARRKRRDA